MNELLFDFYSKPTQYGGEMPYYSGERYNQIGGGFFANVGRFLLPILKTVGKNVLGLGAEVANDVINKNENFENSLKSHARKRIRKAINNDDIFTKHNLL